MSRIKNQILSKLKEYASKMGTNTMGGDDYTSKKRGGLRDFDGYDNVDYNRDMPMDEATKGDVMRAVKGKPNPYSLVVIKRGKVIYQKDIKNPQDAPAIYSVIRKHMDKGERIHIEDRTGKIVFKEGINEACWKGYKEVGGKIKNGKQVPNCVPESIEEGMMSTIDQIRQDSKNVRDFIKKVFSDSDFRDMKGDKDFIKYLGNIYEGIEENFPSNWLQGRTSDYHTKLRGKKRDYDDTNFVKNNSGQPDIEDEIEESGKEKSEKNYKDWKSTNEGFDKIEHLKLLNKAMRAMPGSPKQKDIIRKLNVVRKAGGMRPLKERTKTDFNSKGYKEASKLIAKLRSTTFKKMNGDELEQFRAALAFSFDLKEYASKLTLSYILDKDSKLDGTPEDKDAINREVTESLKDMVGDTYTFSIGSSDQKLIKPNTKEYVLEMIAKTIKHNLYDYDFSLNSIDGSQAKEYSKIFDNDVLKPLLRNIDKTLKTYFKLDSKNKKISWKLSSRDNDKIIDAFFKKNKKISSKIRDSYFSQNESSQRDYKDEYKKFQSSTKSKKYRAELNKYNRDKGTYGNGDGKDASHKGGKIVGFESASKNRGRREKSRLKK